MARATAPELHFINKPDRSYLWLGLGIAIYFCVSVAVAWGSLTIEDWPLAIGLLPLLVLLEACGISLRTAIGAGWMMPAALPIGWGLWQLGHPLMAFAVPLAAIALFVASLLTLRLGLTCLALIALPIWPNNPLIYLADLGLSREALLATALIVVIVEWLPYHRWLRRSLAMLAAFALTFLALMPKPVSQQSVFNGYLLGNYTTRIQAVTPYGEWRAIAEWAGTDQARGAEIVILPESATHEAEAVPPWCRDLSLMPDDLYAGVLLDDGRAELRYYTQETCPNGIPFGYADLPIPYLTDGHSPQQDGAGGTRLREGAETRDLGSQPDTPSPRLAPFAFWDDLIWRATGLTPDPKPRPAVGPLTHADWVICFEAFSLTYWLGVDPNTPTPIFVLSNDSWTDPIPVPTMRRKFSIAVSRMIGRDVLFAERGRSLILGRSIASGQTEGPPS